MRGGKMNSRKKTVTLLSAIVLIAAIVGMTAYAQNVETGATGAPTYQYTAKYVCGLSQDPTTKSPVLPGTYRTSINVHNPQASNVTIMKKAVQSSREMENPIPPGKLRSYTIRPDYSFEIDCEDVYLIGGVPSGTLFSEGFVVIQSPRQIDVKAVYTAGAPATASSSVVTMDIETIEPKISVPVATQYVDTPS